MFGAEFEERAQPDDLTTLAAGFDLTSAATAHHEAPREVYAGLHGVWSASAIRRGRQTLQGLTEVARVSAFDFSSEAIEKAHQTT